LLGTISLAALLLSSAGAMADPAMAGGSDVTILGAFGGSTPPPAAKPPVKTTPPSTTPPASTPPATTPPATTPPATTPPPTAGPTLTDPAYIAEYAKNYSLAQMNAAAAYARGYSGAGIITAVFDSGLDTSNSQFIGRIAGPGYDAIAGKVGVTTDDQWHGTFVSGIIAADRDGVGMMGVAYGAQLLPIRVINPNGSLTLTDAQLAAGINYATAAGAKVFNNSWNSATPISQVSLATIQYYMPKQLAAYRAAVKAGAIIVFAAGNNGASQPGYYAALPADFPDLQAGWVAAVATDSTGIIASYSDRCGATAAWCLAAPGSNLVSAYHGGLSTGSGTSFAAPQVSAAADILWQEFPYLTNQQILQILFKSATKTGIYANQAIYGQGLLNLDAATQPIGTVTVAQGTAVTGKTTPLGTTGAAMSGTFGAAFAKSLANQQMLVLDSFERGYTVPMSSVVRVAGDSFDALRALQGLGGGNMETARVGSTTLEFAYSVQPQSGGADGRPVPGKFFLHSDLAAKQGLELGYNVSPSLSFGAYSRHVVSEADLPMGEAAAIPYLDLADKGWNTAYSTQFAGLGTLKFGAFAGQAKSSPFEDNSYFDPSRDPKLAGIYGGVAEMTVHLGDNVNLGVDSGMLLERSTFLGTMSDGALAFGQNTPTWFGGFTATARLGDGYALFGGAHIGLSKPSGSGDSLIQSASSVVTQSFNLGLAKEGVWGARDQAGVVFSQPLRAVSGNATVAVPVSRDFFGNVSYTSVTSDLGADGRELNLQGFYKTPVAAGASLNLGAMLRLQPDNVRSAPPAGVAMAQFRMQF
jgi:subtilisin family serine protease